MLILMLVLNIDSRAVWVTRWSIHDNSKIFSCLDDKFDHIFLQVFALGEAYYQSSYAPSKTDGDQWLKDFLAEAHRRNIKVSAWLNVYYSWGYAAWPTDPLHPMNRHQDWYVLDETGRSILDYDVSDLRHAGLEGYYLAPANPYVRSYLIKIIEELTQYNFDGIHLDYVRYPNHEYVYDAAMRTKFMREYYFDPMDFLSPIKDLGTRLNLWGYDDLKRRYATYVKDDLSDFIREVNRAVKTASPTMMVSVAVKPDYGAARRDFHQDWVGWLDSGLVDFVCLMAYSHNIKPILDKTLLAVKNPDQVMVGLGLYDLSVAEIRKQVNQVQASPFAGVVFFSYEEIKKDNRYLQTLPSTNLNFQTN